MTPDPLIFHITHVDNLPSIVACGCLWSDASMRRQGAQPRNIGYEHIKSRRLRRPVLVAARGMLGEYVPFNFCPRSVMLYVIHQGHFDYAGGQEEIVHLVSSVGAAFAAGRPWAFTDRHAELTHALYFDDVRHLNEVRWDVMRKTFWSEVKEERQAEFLVHDWFPWTAFSMVAAHNDATAAKVRSLLEGAAHQPLVHVQPEWYY